MNLVPKRSVRSFTTLALLAIALLAGTGPLAFAQESIQGTMTLPFAARLGSTLLPPGEYKFSAQLIGATHSVGSIRLISTPVSFVVIGSSKNAPVASAVGWAYRPDRLSAKSIELKSGSDGAAIRSLSLRDVGLVVQFFDAHTHATMRASMPQPSPTTLSAKSSD